ncbi:MAG: hypothetical protein QOI41_339 [Myxococcales bacterium]|nr:hypothetical protein [Myxococcales bacterium]
MGIDTRLLLRMPLALSVEDCLGDSLQALVELPAEQRATIKEVMITSAGKRLSDGTLVYCSNVHFTPPRQALEREAAEMVNALAPTEGAAVRAALAGMRFTPSPELERVLGDFRESGGIDGAFERFRKAVAEELVEQFGTSLKQMHDDARGLLAFPELVELHASTYDAALAQVERHGVWLPFPRE